MVSDDLANQTIEDLYVMVHEGKSLLLDWQHRSKHLSKKEKKKLRKRTEEHLMNSTFRVVREWDRERRKRRIEELRH